MPIKFIISDLNSDHAASVKAALLLGANGALSESEIEIRYGGFVPDLQYAASIAAVGVIRSTTGLTSYIPYALQYYLSHGIQSFVPAGSNSPGEIFESNGGTNLPSIIITGAGDLNNETADDIEFFAPDVITGEPDLSSFGGPFITGEVFAVMVARNCTWWEARYCCRMTGSREGVWHEVDGFGLINVAAAIAYAGEIPLDPYVAEGEGGGGEESPLLVGPVGTLIGSNVEQIATLTAAPVTNAELYYLEKKKIQSPLWGEPKRGNGRYSIPMQPAHSPMCLRQAKKCNSVTAPAINTALRNIPTPLHLNG